MAVVRDAAGERWFRESVSPDGRHAIDSRPYPDPRSQYEVNFPEAVTLRDLATGAAIVELPGVPMERHRWRPDGGLEMDFIPGLTASVTPDMTHFTGSGGGAGEAEAGTQPIAALGAWVARNQPPPAPPALAPTPPRPRMSMARMVAVALLLAIAVATVLW